MKKFFANFLIFAALLMPCSVDAEPSEAKAFNIGMLVCLTGNCADWGNAALKGAQLASQGINKSGGVLGRKIVLKAEDTRESLGGAQAVSAFRKLVDRDKLRLIIGPSWSPGAIAIEPLVAQRDDLLVITPSASAESFNKAGPHMFNMRPAERLATERLARFAFDKGWSKAAIFASQQPAVAIQGKLFADEFRRSGGTVVAHVEPNPELSDLRSEALKITRAKPDVVFLMIYNQMYAAAKNLRSLGYRGSLLAISIDENRVTGANGLLEGAYVAKAAPPQPEFSQKFLQAFKEPPGLSAENGYDAILALAEGIRASNSLEPQKIAQQLKQLSFDGASGKIRFDESGAVNQKPTLYKVASHKMKRINWDS